MSVSAPPFYFRLPAWCQDLAVTAMGVSHRWRRSDPAEQRRFLAFLEQSERWPDERMECWQAERLRDLLDHACRTVPHWRALREELGFDPGDVARVADLSGLPVLEKDLVKEQPRSFEPDVALTEPVVHLNTSGTTGTPMRVVYTRRAFARKWACVARLRQWHGVRRPLLPQRIQITGSPLFDPERERRRPWRYNRAARTLMVPVNGINSDLAPRLLAGLRAFTGVEVMDGYPSALVHLARLGIAAGIEGPAIPLIITTAETLRAADRELLAVYFQGRVIDQYSASEPSVFVGECEEGSLHLFPQSGILELEPLPGQDPATEHLARIIMTPLHNPAQVLIRYAIGDLARVQPGRRCGCGRPGPVIEAVEGRAADVIDVETPQGRRALTNALLSTGFYGFAEIVRGQVVQAGPAAIVVRCQVAGAPDPSFEAAVARSFERVCGAGVTVAVERVDRFELGPNGKFRAVVPLQRGGARHG